MTRGVITIVLFLQTILSVSAQKKDSIPDLSKGNYVITNLQPDTIKERNRAAEVLRKLIDGSVIVRLKTNQKSIDAYRKAGKINIAEKIELNRKSENQKIYDAFINNFHFCKVYFIYAHDTRALLDSNQKIFLNRDLQYDNTISITDTNFIFCEYGSVEPFSKFNDYPSALLERHFLRVVTSGQGYAASSFYDRPEKILDTFPTQTSTSPIYGLFFSDKNLNQFHRPFPYVEAVYFDNPGPAVKSLNRQLERAYYRLVTNNDFRVKIKAEKKKERAKKKASPKYNPFK